MKVLIDTDPGTDDALALIMALNSPKLDVIGLTTVGGNASLASTTRNALRLLAYLGRGDVPVSRGASRPLCRDRFRYAPYFHGPGGLTVRLPPTEAAPIETPAADYIVETVSAHRGDVVVLALGPLTNVAAAMAKEPRLADWAREVVVMGGAIEVDGNVTPYAEFNVYNDPDAAQAVLSSGAATTLVGLDVCNRVCLTAGDVGWLFGSTPGEQLAHRMITNWFRRHGDDASYNLCDPLAVVAALRPDLFGLRSAGVDVETEDEERIGQTSARYEDGGSVKIALDVRVDEAMEVIRTLLRP